MTIRHRWIRIIYMLRNFLPLVGRMNSPWSDYSLSDTVTDRPGRSPARSESAPSFVFLRDNLDSLYGVLDAAG